MQFFLIGAILILFFNYWYITLPLILCLFVPSIIRHIQKNRYFASEEFIARKKEIKALVAEHNDVAEYVQTIRDNKSLEIGFSSTGEHAHLASCKNTSHHNYKRDRNVAQFGATNVHNCSLQVVRNATQNPIKYLIKYFGINTTEETLADVETFGETISRIESAISNLKVRESSIAKTFAPPDFILKHFKEEFMQLVGVKLLPLSIPYPDYAFEYVSAGGNSGQKTTLTLDTPTIDALIETLSEKTRFRKSSAGQRALMTAKLREFIKKRDNYTCKYCVVSLMDEPHLLLEVDHILPISKGGLSTEDNLQTLCWRCNRTKSNKVPCTSQEITTKNDDPLKSKNKFTEPKQLHVNDNIKVNTQEPKAVKNFDLTTQTKLSDKKRKYLPSAKKLLKSKDYNEAILWLNTAIQNREDLPNAYYLRAFAFNKISNKKKSLSNLKKAAEYGNNKAIDVLKKRADSN